MKKIVMALMLLIAVYAADENATQEPKKSVLEIAQDKGFITDNIFFDDEIKDDKKVSEFSDDELRELLKSEDDLTNQAVIFIKMVLEYRAKNKKYNEIKDYVQKDIAHIYKSGYQEEGFVFERTDDRYAILHVYPWEDKDGDIVGEMKIKMKVHDGGWVAATKSVDDDKEHFSIHNID